jgi:hypothetical protein
VLLVELAAIDAGLGRVQDGATALLEAVRLVGGAGDAVRTYQALIPDRGSWHELRSALRAYLTQHDLEPSARVTVLREIARIERDAIEEITDAGRTLTEAIELAPDDIELRTELVASLIAAGTGRDALVAARELVTLAPRHDQSWRLLSQAFGLVGVGNAARMALAPLVAGDAASPDELREIGEASALLRDLAGVSFDLEMIRRAGGESAPNASAERALMASFDAFPKLYPAACRAHANLSALSRVKVRDSHPLRAIVVPVARVFAIDELELYVGDRNTPVRAVAQHTPALTLPEDLEDASPGAQRFLLGRAPCMLLRGGQAFEILDDSELELLLAAVQRMGSASLDPPAGVEHAGLQDTSKRLAKALPRRARRPLEEAATRLLRDGTPDIARWRHEVRRSATRVGLLLSHDLVAAWPYLAEDQASVEDALLFWTSDLSFKIRASGALPGYS